MKAPIDDAPCPGKQWSESQIKEDIEAAKKMQRKPQQSQMSIADNLIVSGETNHKGSKACWLQATVNKLTMKGVNREI